MAYLIWNEEYSVGISSIDEQHKKLFEILNNLHDAMKIGKAKNILSQIITELFEYTTFHFSTEENYLQTYNYPTYLGHKKEHNIFVAKVIEFQDKFNLSSGMTSIEMLHFLKDWISQHVMGTDKKYSEYLLKKGAK
ncbi:MAG: bacteriohemerythrin [Ignavibacteriales bacterium]|nr:bacteriohemerythrin [Ignavibacteriales bacterium]